MMQVKRKHADESDENLTVTKATYANAEQSAVILETVEAGKIIADFGGDLWEQIVSKKIPIESAPELSYEDMRVLEGHPPVGDQLDAEFKARQKRRLIVGKARKAIKEGADAAAVLVMVLEALEPTEEQSGIDARLQAIKEKHPKK